MKRIAIDPMGHAVSLERFATLKPGWRWAGDVPVAPVAPVAASVEPADTKEPAAPARNKRPPAAAPVTAGD